MGRRTGEEIVAAVIEAAHELFSERPPAAVSLREVADRAGVNLGLIHRYVGSKGDLVEAVLELHTRRATRVAEEVRAGERDVFAAVADAVVSGRGTGRLMAGLILEGEDLVAMKGEFPLVDLLTASDGGDPIAATTVYALALGWELFAPALLAASGADPSDEEVRTALADAMRAVWDSPRGAARP